MKGKLGKLRWGRSRASAYLEPFDVRRRCPELSAELAAPVLWQRSEQRELAGETAARFRATPGALKWHHYFPIYDELFARLREKPIRMLEIGVYKGASLAVWRQYFHSETTIVGIDIDPECARYADSQARLHIRIGPQQDPTFLAEVVREFGPFDLIIDDGSHVVSHVIATFNELFAKSLSDGGLYFVEDLHTNYWPGYRDTRRSFLDFCYGLVECMHAQYAAVTDEVSFRAEATGGVAAVEVPRITTLIREIRFMDSVVAIYKAARSLPRSQHW